MCFCGHHSSCSVKFLFKSFPIFNWLVYLLIELEKVFIFSGSKFFISFLFLKYLLSICGLSFHFLTITFEEQKFLSLVTANLSGFFFFFFCYEMCFLTWKKSLLKILLLYWGYIVTPTTVLTIYLRFTPPAFSLSPLPPFLEQFQQVSVFHFHTSTYNVHRIHPPLSKKFSPTQDHKDFH
jgi:hypothetical protein